MNILKVKIMKVKCIKKKIINSDNLAKAKLTYNKEYEVIDRVLFDTLWLIKEDDNNETHYMYKKYLKEII